MDHEGSPAQDADFPSDPVREKQPEADTAGSLLVRVGYRTLIGSVIVTVIGTIMLAQGRTSFEATASIIRQIGAVFMLISCAIAFNWAMVFITGLLGVGVRYYLIAGRRCGGPRGD